MSKHDDGGAAFPLDAGQDYDGDKFVQRGFQGGMTLRDWFAGQALAGVNCFMDRKDLNAMQAYEMADAMLAERNKEQ